MTGLSSLLDLQAVDTEIDRLRHERQSLPALEEYRAAHQHLTGLTAERDRTAADLRQTSLDLDRVSGEFDLNEARVAAEQNRLYAGGLSARDADYLRREVEMLKNQQRDREEGVLVLMDRKDQLAAGLERLEAEVAAAEAVKAEHEAVVSAAWAEIDAKLAIRQGHRDEVVAGIDPDVFELYESIRPTMDDGVAAAALNDGVCGACHLRLAAPEQAEALRADPPRCVHCRAILVP
jgi:predicted  nucleic acid-binding Zn-ribbon protein